MMISMRSNTRQVDSYINLDNVREIRVDKITGTQTISVTIFYIHNDMAFYTDDYYDLKDFLKVIEELVANDYASRRYP